MYMLQATPTEILTAIRIWVVKISSLLNITLQEQSNGLNSMSLPPMIRKGITLDSSGYFYITGHTNGGLYGNTNAGYTDIFLMKLDSSGIIQ